MAAIEAQSTTTTAFTTKDLQKNRSLWYKIHVFIYDLRNFREIPTAQARLDRVVDASYIGMPYFTSDEVAILKNTVVEGDRPLEVVIKETLSGRLERRIKKRVGSGDYRVCAAHDLAPIFEKAFDINIKDSATNREFLVILDRSGLKLKDNDKWTGLGKKSFSPKKKGAKC